MSRSWSVDWDRAARAAAYRHAPSTHYDRRDLYQEAALALLRRRPKDAALANTIAHRAVIDFLRKHGRHDRFGRDRGHLVDLAEHEHDQGIPSHEDAVVERLHRQWQVRTATAAIARAGLTKTERAVVTLALAGRNVTEIAAYLGKQKGTIHVHLSRGARKVRDHIAA